MEQKNLPVFFMGHGSPINGIEENEFSQGWTRVAKTIPKPEAILCISAHWQTKGTFVTAMNKPQTIHDFYGFPKELYDVQYPAPGSKWLAEETKKVITNTRVDSDRDWGLDHGCWIVLRQMFPQADYPLSK